jgi:hemolysin activation/secretion protein
MKRFIIFALLMASLVINVYGQNSSASPPAGTNGAPDMELLPVLKGVVILDSVDAVNPNGVAEPGIHFKGPKFLTSNDVAVVMTPFIGQRLTTNSLHTLEKQLILLCRKHDHPVVDVIAPEQDFTSGVLQIAILEGKVGNVTVARKGGKWYSDAYIRRNIRVKQGDPIIESQLLEDINWLNQNSYFRDVNVAFSQGALGGETDIHLEETDRFPVRVSAGYDDEGPKIIGEDRVFAGLLWGNAFGLDQRFNYQYTTDTSFEFLKAHTAGYDIPLPWRNTLTFFGSYADVRAKYLPPPLIEEGSSYQASMRYAIPLPKLGHYTHEVSLGYDFKHSDNNLEFGGSTATLAATPTDVDQFFGGYRALLPDSWGESDLAIQSYYSPGNLTSENTRARFSVANPGPATPWTGTASEYYYLHFNADRSITNLPAGFKLLFRVQAQLTDCKLLPSEQMGFGGMDTVRGYDERFVNGDRGVVVNSELHTPQLSLGGDLFGSSTPDTLEGLIFADYGSAYVIDPDAGPDHFTLASVGVGARYRISRHLDLQVDYGFQLVRNEFLINQVPVDSSSSRGHIALVVSY